MEPRLLKKDAAAAWSGLPVEEFTQLVKDGVMPAPIPGTRLFDRVAIERVKVRLAQQEEAERRRNMPKPQPTVHDRFEPPRYEHLRRVQLGTELQKEFGVTDSAALAAKLNELWIAEGRRPLAQGSFPSKAAKLPFVVKEIRLALVRAASR